VDNTRDYARVSHNRQWSNYNILHGFWRLVKACEPTTHAAGAQTVVDVMAVWFVLTITTTVSGELAAFIRLVIARSFLCQHMQSFTISRQCLQYDQWRDDDTELS